MTINGSVVKIRMEHATAQRATAPVNKNGSLISRNDFVTFHDAAFKPQTSEQVVWLSIGREALQLGRDVSIGSLHASSLSGLQFREKLVKMCYRSICVLFEKVA